MKNAVWRGRFMVLCLAATAVLTTGGCGGLSDRQLSSIFQSVLTTGLSTAVNTALTAMAGTPSSRVTQVFRLRSRGLQPARRRAG